MNQQNQVSQTSAEIHHLNFGLFKVLPSLMQVNKTTAMIVNVAEGLLVYILLVEQL